MRHSSMRDPVRLGWRERSSQAPPATNVAGEQRARSIDQRPAYTVWSSVRSEPSF